MSDVEAFYDEHWKAESRRTTRSLYHRVEQEIIDRVLREQVPDGSAVLDIGCGPGNHAVRLASRGCAVGLVDISSRLLAVARERFTELALDSQLLEVSHSSVETFQRTRTEPYDAALLFGPLYHLVARDDRISAVRIARSNVRNEGLVVGTFVARFAVIKDFVKAGDMVGLRRLLSGNYLETGIYDSTVVSDGRTYMPATHTSTVDDAVELFRSQDLDVIDVVACESFLAFLAPYVNATIPDEASFADLVDIAYGACRHPDLLGGADHFLVVGRAR